MAIVLLAVGTTTSQVPLMKIPSFIHILIFISCGLIYIIHACS